MRPPLSATTPAMIRTNPRMPTTIRSMMNAPSRAQNPARGPVGPPEDGMPVGATGGNGSLMRSPLRPALDRIGGGRHDDVVRDLVVPRLALFVPEHPEVPQVARDARDDAADGRAAGSPLGGRRRGGLEWFAHGISRVRGLIRGSRTGAARRATGRRARWVARAPAAAAAPV